MKATDVKTPADWIEYQSQEIERHCEREKELLEQIKYLLGIIVEHERKLNETT
jgi:hypothetical protein